MLGISGLVASPTIDLSSPTKSRQRPGSRIPSSTSATTLVESASPALTRTAVSLEYAALRYTGHCPLGMYITPSVTDLLVWDAVFFVHQGYYTDSILKFRLTFPPNYPERPPVIQFLTDVFHPLISQQDGMFNLAPRFRPWRPKEHHVFDVLHWIKAAFKKQALDEIKESECLNKEAYRQIVRPFLVLLASSMLSQSASALFDSDHPSMAGKGPQGMHFHELKPNQLDTLRAKLGLQDWHEATIS
ncbi:uncharacterized protein FIBRA_01428 [Fibroporia radiculosa]|uniref:UBC core domain-containing protein n=1 Tax=Fibroporia radiculosa TaxID=599839 RepID=J4GK71_9APHY|nr:uncharacterized protein FIBRA_01428 [Fibroporia radiculosa]CCL99410.1 predicted protein [Fibroporia radiculosa]